MEIFKIKNSWERTLNQSHILHKKRQDLTQPILFNHNQIKFIKSGNQFIVIVTKENEIFVYGDNTCGQLSINLSFVNKFTKIDYFFGDIIYLNCERQVTFLMNNNQQILFSGFVNFMENSNYFTNIYHSLQNEKIKFIKIGFNNSYFLITENNVYQQGQLLFTLQNTLQNNKIKDFSSGLQHSILLDNLGNIYGIGRNNYNQLGLDNYNYNTFTKIELPFKTLQISCCNEGTLILNEFNEIFVTGQNNYGELGIDENFYKFTKITTINNKNNKLNIKSIYSSFNDYNIIITTENKIYISGLNDYERFGISFKESKIRNDMFCLEKFTEIKYFSNKKMKFIYPMLLSENIYILISNYKFNEMNEEYNYLGKKCFKKLQQFCDLFILF